MTIYRSPYPALEVPATPFAHFVLARAAERADRAALIESASGRTVTYAQLPRMVDRIRQDPAAGASRPGRGAGLS